MPLEAYTPGLQVSEATLIRKERVLPIPGNVIIKKGNMVTPDTVIARTHMPGPINVAKVSDILRVRPQEIRRCLKKGEGDKVNEGELLGEHSSFFGLFKRTCVCPINGTLEYISYTVGQVHIRGKPTPIDVRAYIPGEVVEVLPKEGAIIETPACFIQGIFGLGGENNGEIVFAVDSPNEILTEDKILPEYSGKIVVGGSLVTTETLKKAAPLVKGIIGGGIDDETLLDFLGYDLGVAITGHEDITTTIIITEGFGQIQMGDRIFDLLKKHEGDVACINGETQIRAGVIRPEILIPLEYETFNKFKMSDVASMLDLGAYVRVIHGPYFGIFGYVTDLPSENQEIETESKTSVVKVHLENGTDIILPRTNVELIK